MIHPYTYAGTFRTVAPTTVTINTAEYGRLVERSNMLEDIMNPKEEKQVHYLKADDIFREVMNEVSKYYAVSEDDIYAESRKRNIVKSRQVVMYMCVKFKMSLVDVAKRLKKHHTSVIHSRDLVNIMIGQDKTFLNEVGYIYGKLSQKLKSKYHELDREQR